MRVTRSRELVAEGYSPSVVARRADQPSGDLPRSQDPAARREAIGAAGRRRRGGDRRGRQERPDDGYRMVCALVARKLGRAVNRKRVLRVMRERRLIQRRRRLDRRRRPGFFRVTRPDELALALVPGLFAWKLLSV